MKLGALFDWDGVVIDSSRQHEESWALLAQELGRPLPADHFLRGFGMKNQVIIPEILGWTHDPEEIHRYSLRKEELYRDIVRERGIEPLPGVTLHKIFGLEAICLGKIQWSRRLTARINHEENRMIVLLNEIR